MIKLAGCGLSRPHWPLSSSLGIELPNRWEIYSLFSSIVWNHVSDSDWERRYVLSFRSFWSKIRYSLHILLTCDSVQSTSSIFSNKRWFLTPHSFIIKAEVFPLWPLVSHIWSWEPWRTQVVSDRCRRGSSVYLVILPWCSPQEYGRLWESVAKCSFPS